MFLLSYYIIFRHLYWTILLTRCPVPVPVFPVFLFLDNLLRKNSELDENLQEFFIEQMKTGAKRATQEAAHRAGAACVHGPPRTRGWDPPVPLGHPFGRLRRL